MSGLTDFRAQHPEYNDISDGDLSDALYRRYYFDMPRSEFDQKMGIAPQPTAAAPTQDQPQKGSFLPVSRDASGLHFDPTAGVMGAAIDALKLPSDVFSGKTQLPTSSIPGSPDAMGRVVNFGMFANPVSPVFSPTSWLKPKVPVPTSGELTGAGGAGRDLARAMGVTYTTDSIVSLANKTQQNLLLKGLGPKVAKATNDVLADLQAVPNDPTAQADFRTTVEAARNNLQSIARGADAQDGKAASEAIAALDEFIKGPPPGSVVAGPASALGETFTDANSNYAAGSRAKTLEALATRTGNRAAASGSGLNIDNTVRARVADFINPTPTGGPSKAQRAGFTDSEIALLQNVVDGKGGRNSLRALGNLLGGGAGLGATTLATVAGTGAAVGTGNPALALLGLIPPAAGIGARIAQNAAAKSALADVTRTVRTRSALYNERAADAVPRAVSPAQRGEIINALLKGLPIGELPPPPPNKGLTMDAQGNVRDAQGNYVY